MFDVKEISKKISVCCVIAALVTVMPAGCGKKNETQIYILKPCVRIHSSI